MPVEFPEDVVRELRLYVREGSANARYRDVAISVDA
jgi:hypothetical protein